ncbi:hypothetical protein IW140_005450 [Coemansia sp. RSA 1813]|nr:hypothetical protein LPJ74_004546 [Coemansia sp. RSA 1843]KAJ2565192.1 hypothetical protein IW140_005450 [Coemansia sp. RSA 1813]
MLRSKNLKKILEQVLTKDISICAVFNEDGVVLAHASTPNSSNAHPFTREPDNKHNSTHFGSDTWSTDPTKHGHGHSGLKGEADVLRNDYGSTSSVGNYQHSIHQTQNQHPIYSNSKHVAGTEPVQRRQPNTSSTFGTTSLTAEPNTHSSPAFVYEASGASRQNDDSDSATTNSCLSSYTDDIIGNPPNLSMREKLEDDLAIAANIWQSYEGVSGLIERKDRDMDEPSGDGNSEIHDDSLGNSLNMIIIECEYGKAVVTKLGSYRLFLLSKASTPLGLLRFKSHSLGRYLEECLRRPSP